MKKIVKTNAARLLDQAQITYELYQYDADLSRDIARHAAEALSIELASLFKTLLIQGEHTGYLVCIIPGDRELDLKKVARLSGNKKTELVPVKDIQKISGYERGGCSPIGMKKHFAAYIHESCSALSLIAVSAGAVGLQMRLAPTDLISFIQAQVGDLCVD